MAAKENVAHIWEKFKEIYNRMELRQRLMIVFLLVVTLCIVIWMISWSSKVEYTLLFAKLSPEDASRTMESLKKMGIKYKLEDKGTAIYIVADENKLYETRINLATGWAVEEGALARYENESGDGVSSYSTSPRTGFELFDKTSLGTTEFVLKNVNYVRALQGELEKTIMFIDGIEDVRIHLVVPEERIFKEDQQNPSAAVTLKITKNKKLTDRQVEGITFLIASSVAGLDPENITILDQEGKNLTKPEPEIPVLPPTPDPMNIVTQRYALRTKIVEEMRANAQAIFNNTYGFGQSNVQVQVELDWDQIESASEIYDPERSVIVSEETTVNNETNLMNEYATVREGQITNYNNSVTHQTKINQIGAIKRLTASAIVNYRQVYDKEEDGTQKRDPDGRAIYHWENRTEEEMIGLENALKGAVMFDGERGDFVSVACIQFNTDSREELEFENAKEAKFKQYVALGEKAAVIGALFIMVLILMSQFKKIFAKPEEEEIEEEEDEVETVFEEEVTEELEDEEPEPEPEPEIPVEETLSPAMQSEDTSMEGFFPEGDEGMPMGDGKITYTFKPMKDIEIEQTEAMLLQETITKFVVENPEIAVKLIKSWLMDINPLGRTYGTKKSTQQS